LELLIILSTSLLFFFPSISHALSFSLPSDTPLDRNCNHFSDRFCKEILGKGIPGYVNRLAWMGSYVECLLPRKLAIETPTAPSPQPTTPVQRFTAFSGTGSRLREDKEEEINEPIDQQTRRARLLEAANRRLQADKGVSK
jgi:hypothetical protein